VEVKMYPKMKSPVSQEKVGEFILECMKLQVEARKLKREIDEMVERDESDSPFFVDDSKQL
jgi:hypothetical protein